VAARYSPSYTRRWPADTAVLPSCCITWRGKGWCRACASTTVPARAWCILPVPTAAPAAAARCPAHATTSAAAASATGISPPPPHRCSSCCACVLLLPFCMAGRGPLPAFFYYPPLTWWLLLPACVRHTHAFLVVCCAAGLLGLSAYGPG